MLYEVITTQLGMESRGVLPGAGGSGGMPGLVGGELPEVEVRGEPGDLRPSGEVAPLRIVGQPLRDKPFQPILRTRFADGPVGFQLSYNFV